MCNNHSFFYICNKSIYTGVFFSLYNLNRGDKINNNHQVFLKKPKKKEKKSRMGEREVRIYIVVVVVKEKRKRK